MIDNNNDNIILFQENFPEKSDKIKGNVTYNETILLIRFPNPNYKEVIYNNIFFGKGLKINKKIWYPKEIWIWY